jgi:hypothetical protein
MNNFERIKQMTVDEMAEWIGKNLGLKCHNCKYYDFENGCQTTRGCEEVIIEQREQWLLQEVENE